MSAWPRSQSARRAARSLAARRRPRRTSSGARSSTTSARRSPCSSSRASTRSASRGSGSRARPRSSPLWRRPWRRLAGLDRADAARVVLALGAVFAVMNVCFYVAIDRLPLGTVAAIEFLPVIALAALGRAHVAERRRARARGRRRLPAHRRRASRASRSASRSRSRTRRSSPRTSCSRTGSRGRPGVEPARRPRRGDAGRGGRRRRRSAGWSAAPALVDPVALAAGIGVGVSSSVMPYVFDQLAMARLRARDLLAHGRDPAGDGDRRRHRRAEPGPDLDRGRRRRARRRRGRAPPRVTASQGAEVPSRP